MPVLVIASNSPGELTYYQAYCSQIGQNGSLWYVPDAGHIEALNTHPQEYIAHIRVILTAAFRRPGSYLASDNSPGTWTSIGSCLAVDPISLLGISSPPTAYPLLRNLEDVWIVNRAGGHSALYAAKRPHYWRLNSL